MELLLNPFRGNGLDHPALVDIPRPAEDPSGVLALLSRCPEAGETPMVSAPDLAHAAGVGALWVKDERGRMGLGSFKALGAAHVIAREAQQGLARGRTYVTASAGNHGLSVAAGARAFGATARVYIARTVPESFEATLRAQGADVRREGADYEASMAAAARAAEEEGLELLSDSSWPGYVTRPHVLMEGYLALMAEAAQQLPGAPTHVFLQAGVGGLAGAAAAFVRAHWGAGPKICVVEPDYAPALAGSIAAGAPVAAEGPVSIMGRLDCKEPSLIALKGLAQDADGFLTITEAEAARGAARAAGAGLASTPSGAAGIAGLLALAGQGAVLDLGPASRVLVILSEMAEAPA
ncbi:diaminopropionate ammonia-lyase [Pseudooceanicola antarcticus]|uniref:Diaminopropionate ammonia-lyase n=1 Tax=Pseudooceanicola antarcticus TaxID=1247613 RepID=A0A285IT01_9RHOB|nr:pyridoxal-phosphate dependent enzyme [Pseudooceanicola antarcticus]PJE31982.1 PLP-dependent lyase/thiolase [Pseudooceanicola antarcticus]SNY51118.1 diaminopropionate ammonia-lyase [Pseudooceanicola antarcticus]